MKKIITPILLSTLLFSSFLLASNHKEVEATQAAAPSNYYSSITSSMKGDTLKVALYNIIKGHTPYDYDNLEIAMKVTDRDYDLSPLGTDDDDPYMNILYADYNFNKSTAVRWGNSVGGFNIDGDAVWNKEHIWAKANGFSSKGLDAYCDLHHLRASDERCNNLRGNLPFNTVSSHTSSYAVENHYKKNTDNYRITNDYFEPRDKDKGDVARALFYMATRYYNGDGSGGTHLTLTNGTDGSGGKWGYLDTLLAWHEADPVDEFEAHRNDLIYEQFQHNRNPYIDHPEYARAVFKNEPIVTPDTLTNLTYTGTPSKTSYKEGESFNSNGLTVTATLKKNDNSTYTKDVTSEVTWTPNPLTKGTTYVTGSYTYGDVTKTIQVSGLTVSTLDNIRISGNPSKAIYDEGDTFVSTGISVFARYGAEEVNVTSSATWDDTPLVKGQTSVNVTYGTKQATYYGILVKEKTATSNQVEFKDYGSSTGELNKDTIQSDLVKGKDIVTVSAVSKAFKGSGGVRFGSGSAGGSITLTLSSTQVTKLVINAKVYGSDSTTVTVKTNGSSSGTFTPTSSFLDYEISVNKNVTSITISSSSSNQRFYLKGFDIYSGSGSDSDSLKEWGVSYLHIGDSSFDGQGTGLCKSQDLYKHAKVALFNLNSAESGTISKLQNDSKYSSEYARYLAWADANHDHSPLINDFSFVNASIDLDNVLSSNYGYIAIIIISITITTLGLSTLLLVKKHKRK